MPDYSDKIKTKTIDGKQITVTPFFGLVSLENKSRLLKFIGPGARGLFSTLKTEDVQAVSSGEKDFFDLDVSAIGAVFEHIATNLNPKQFAQFCLDMLSSTRVNGIEIDKNYFDTEFMGSLLLMYKILWFVVEVNWGDFFGAGGFGKMKKKVLKKETPKSAE